MCHSGIQELVLKEENKKKTLNSTNSQCHIKHRLLGNKKYSHFQQNGPSFSSHLQLCHFTKFTESHHEKCQSLVTQGKEPGIRPGSVFFARQLFLAADCPEFGPPGLSSVVSSPRALVLLWVLLLGVNSRDRSPAEAQTKWRRLHAVDNKSRGWVC